MSEHVEEEVAQVKALKVPAVEHVAVPPPENPSLQVTVTAAPVVPVIEPTVDLLEFATSVAVQELDVPDEQVSVLKVPAIEHVAVPPPVNPWLQETATVAPVAPMIAPSVDLLEFAT